ncbi:hypothetical protein PIROE2DRAFT_16643, partial [Piromyces sp. E2]
MYIRLLDLNSQYQNEKDNSNNSSYALKAYNLFKKILGINSSTDVSENYDKAFIKQLLSGKTGIFRSMCLAKRQNFCLRSVIVPNIDTPLDRILIPKEFTDQLTPYGYKPNDFVIINRQPTLQTTSLLSVRSFPSNNKTIQINPLIASVFQADFDGKEAKKELLSNLNISNNIRSYKNSSLMIKFIQDTLTGLYNMTRDKDIADIYVVKKICNKLNIPNKKWNYFRKYYKSRMKTSDIPYSHLLSLLLPKTLSIKHKNKMIVNHGILLVVYVCKDNKCGKYGICGTGSNFCSSRFNQIIPSVVDSSNIVIHNNITSMYIRLLDLNSQYQNEKDNSNNSSYALKAYNLFKKILGINSSTDVSENYDKAFIKQLLSGKTGIFRSMCLAKRQNF